MIGQDRIINKIENITISSLPHSLILLGDKGSGRHTIVSLIADKLNLTVIDITNDITQETIENAYFRSEPYIYLIDSDNITVKQENMILKFLEEPLKNSFIIILCRNSNSVLPTIWNRCFTWQLNRYTKDTLKYFTDNELILQIATTPGQVIELENASNLDQMIDLSNKIINKISLANFSNILTIPDKIAFNNEQNKFDIDLFIKILLYCVEGRIIKVDKREYILLYQLTHKLYSDSFIPHINKKNIFENYLLRAREELRR
jgi:replication-associated recombination protein RarA